MKKDCIENLDKCKAHCCKYLGFHVYNRGKQYLKDVKSYYKMYPNVRVIDRGTFVVVLIKQQCGHLDSDNTCKNYSNRHSYCREGYSKVKESVIFFPHCIYTPDKKSVIIREDELDGW